MNENLVFTIPNKCLPRRFVSSKPTSLCWFIAYVSDRYNYGNFLTNCIRLSDETCSRSPFQVVNSSSRCDARLYISFPAIPPNRLRSLHGPVGKQECVNKPINVVLHNPYARSFGVFFINRITRRLFSLWTNPGLYWRWRSSSRYFLPPTGIVNRYKYLDFTSSYTPRTTQQLVPSHVGVSNDGSLVTTTYIVSKLVGPLGN